MSEREKGITRREFISKNIKGVGLVGLGGVIGVAASRVITRGTGERAGGIGSSYEEELRELSAVDPALMKYRETGKISINSGQLRAIAVDAEDRIYVAADRAILMLNRDGTSVSEVRLKDQPRCLTVTEDGHIYVGMEDHVEVYSPAGGLRSNWGIPGRNAVLTSIAVSGNDVFVADAGNREILRYDATGGLMRRIGNADRSRNIPGFTVPSPYFDVAISPDGLLRVANPGQHRVEAYTFEGDFEFSWGNPSMGIEGFCGCCNPVNFAMLPDGRFVTCEKGLPRVKVYSIDGGLESVVAGPDAFTENARACALDGLSNCRTGGMDVAVDSTGRVMVMDPVERTLRIFEEVDKLSGKRLERA